MFHNHSPRTGCLNSSGPRGHFPRNDQQPGLSHEAPRLLEKRRLRRPRDTSTALKEKT